MEHATNTEPLLRIYRFAGWLFRSTPLALEHRGQTVELRPQALQILDELLLQVGEVVARKRLKKAVFADRPFLDHRQAINLAISQLRRALGDDARRPRFIETVGSRGYRFIYPVEVESASLRRPASGASASEAERLVGSSLLPAPTAKLVAICLLTLLLGSSPVIPGGNPTPRLYVAPWSCADETCSELARALTDELPARVFAATPRGWTVQTRTEPGDGVGDSVQRVEAGLRTIAAGRRVVSLRLTTADGVLLWASTDELSDDEIGPWLDRGLAEMLADPPN